MKNRSLEHTIRDVHEGLYGSPNGHRNKGSRINPEYHSRNGHGAASDTSRVNMKKAETAIENWKAEETVVEGKKKEYESGSEEKTDDELKAEVEARQKRFEQQQGTGLKVGRKLAPENKPEHDPEKQEHLARTGEIGLTAATALTAGGALRGLFTRGASSAAKTAPSTAAKTTAPKPTGTTAPKQVSRTGRISRALDAASNFFSRDNKKGSQSNTAPQVPTGVEHPFPVNTRTFGVSPALQPKTLRNIINK